MSGIDIRARSQRPDVSNQFFSSFRLQVSNKRQRAPAFQPGDVVIIKVTEDDRVMWKKMVVEKLQCEKGSWQYQLRGIHGNLSADGTSSADKTPSRDETSGKVGTWKREIDIRLA